MSQINQLAECHFVRDYAESHMQVMVSFRSSVFCFSEIKYVLYIQNSVHTFEMYCLYINKLTDSPCPRRLVRVVIMVGVLSVVWERPGAEHPEENLHLADPPARR